MKPMQDNEIIEENTSNDVGADTNSRVYELGYLLVPTISEENLPVMYGNIKELVSSFSGELISDEMPKMIPLRTLWLKLSLMFAINLTRHILVGLSSLWILIKFWN